VNYLLITFAVGAMATLFSLSTD